MEINRLKLLAHISVVAHIRTVQHVQPHNNNIYHTYVHTYTYKHAQRTRALNVRVRVAAGAYCASLQQLYINIQPAVSVSPQCREGDYVALYEYNYSMY